MASKNSKNVYRKYANTDILHAAKLVQVEKKTIYEASKTSGVPYNSLKRFLKGNPDLSKQNALIPKTGKPFALNVQREQELYKYIIKMQELGFGLTVVQIRKLAYTLAKIDGREKFFSKAKETASKWWWGYFSKRYQLCLRVPENLSAYRASCANPVLISDFYDKLELLVTSLNVNTPVLKNHIWNVDETGLQFVVKPNKVVTAIGKKYIYKRSWGERGETTTLVGCVCANGSWIPPFVIFKGVRNNERLKDNALFNTQVRLSKNGWVNADIFREWFEFFIKTVSVRPIGLIMDSHGAHMTPDIFALAAENDIHLLTFPAHTTHLLQPLDVGVYKSLKSAWGKVLNEHMAGNPNDKPTRLKFFEFFNPAFIAAMSHSNITNAFKRTGILPFNRTVIPADATAPSQLTADTESPTSPDQCDQEDEPVSKLVDSVQNNTPLPEDQLPVPKTSQEKKRPSRRCPKAKVISPNIASSSDMTNDMRQRRRIYNNDKPGPSKPELQLGENIKGKIKGRKLYDDWKCSVCKKFYSNDEKMKNGAEWIQCSFCQQTFHLTCQSDDPDEETGVFMCDECAVRDQD